MKCYLIDPNTNKVAAELVPGKKVTVFSSWMSRSIEEGGIAVTGKFKKEFKTASRVRRKDGEEVFARAFKQFYYDSGPKQRGYYWTDKHPSTWPSTEELAKDILAVYKKSVEKPLSE